MNILVVDDHPMMVESWVSELQTLIPESKIYTAFNGNQAIEMTAEVKPSVIILDVNLPGMHGYEVAKVVHNMDPSIKLIIFTNINSDAMVLNLIELKVQGFLLKNSCNSNEMKTCIEKVLRGEEYYCQSVEDIIRRNAHTVTNLPKVHLTQRETTLIQLIAAGKSTKQMSAIIGLKENTINSYKDELLKKTKTSNGAELVAYAIRNGLISF